MKSTGIVRKIDELGRIVVPKEIRKTFGINEDDPLEIFVNGNMIILRKHNVSCIFCGSCEGITEFKGQKICTPCLLQLKNK